MVVHYLLSFGVPSPSGRGRVYGSDGLASLSSVPKTNAGPRSLGPALDQGQLARAAVLDRVTDVAEDLRDLPAQEDQGDDRDDRDEGEDQGVLGEALALLVTAEPR